MAAELGLVCVRSRFLALDLLIASTISTDFSAKIFMQTYSLRSFSPYPLLQDPEHFQIRIQSVPIQIEVMKFLNNF